MSWTLGCHFLAEKSGLTEFETYSVTLDNAKRVRADNIVCVWPSTCKDGEALHKFLEFGTVFIQLRISEASWREMASSLQQLVTMN